MDLKCFRCSSWPCTCKDGQTIIHGDCREVLPLLEPVDLVLTDPPYGIDYNPTRSHASASSGGRKQLNRVVGDDREFDPNQCLSMGSHMIMWGANYYASKLPNKGGWLVWDKRDGGSVFRGFAMSDCELAWCSSGKMVRMFSHRWCGHLRDSERNEYRHPTQKPLVLMKWCIEQAPPDVVTVLDPFLGSGTTLRACKDLGRRGIGIEIEERYCEIAANRLRQEVLF